MISTKHGDEMLKRLHKGKEIEKPKMIVDYNDSKSFIDLSDKKKAYSHCLRRGNKWYRKLATELLFGSALVNAHIVYTQVTQTKLTITEFKTEVAIELLGEMSAIETNINDNTDVSHELVEGRKNRCVVCYVRMKNELGRKEAQNK
ncbi:uncharacterized protein [Diabrotica undecimpunctata]|uniref:uncharacterized protein n=1 Tax=Diabrotica undecimpunctata TaxID=50387 RepID=UPI003B637749